MQIKDLPASTSLAATDVLPKETSGGVTQKITGSNLASQVKSLGNLVNTTEMNAAIEQSTATVISGDKLDDVTSLGDLQTKLLTYISSTIILVGQHIVRVTGTIPDAPFNSQNIRPYVMALYKTSATRLWGIIGSPNGGLFHGRYDGSWHWTSIV